jgi:predicted P-loop ATPase
MDRIVYLSAKDIAEALGGKPNGNGGYTCQCPVPGHRDKTPSFSISEGTNGRPVFHCFGGCSQDDIIAELQQRKLWPDWSEQPEPKPKQNKQKAAPNVEWARAGWNRSRDIDPAKPHPYFLSRGIDTTQFQFLHYTLRIDPDAKVEKGGVASGPAVIAAVTDNTGNIVAVQRTFLKTDQSAKRGVDPERKSLGAVKGNAIRFGSPRTSTVMIAEGAEDAMTARAAMEFRYAAWASAGVNALKDIALPDDVKEVILLADNDRPGSPASKSSVEAAWKFRAAGKKVRIAWPPENVKDFNDLVKGKTGAERDAGYRTVKERIEAAEEFTDDARPEPTLKYLRGKGGERRACVANLITMLESDTAFAGLLRHNDFSIEVVVTAALPTMRHSGNGENKYPRALEDDDLTSVLDYAQHHGLPINSKDIAQAAIVHVAKKNHFHPVRDWLKSLTWDGNGRVDYWLIDYLGAEDTPYNRSVGRWFLISMIARVFKPGCKADYTLMFVGTTGSEKSGACAVLGGEWFSDDLPDIHDKDAKLHLRGKWLVEVADLTAFQRGHESQVKAYLTRRVDRYRPPYGRNDIVQPRQTVFIGTTDKSTGIFTDEEGNRRYWPVAVNAVGEINLKALGAARDQILAEAYQLYLKDEPWWPPREFEAEVIVPEQESRRKISMTDERVAKLLETMDDGVTLPEVAKKLATREVLRSGWGTVVTDSIAPSEADLRALENRLPGAMRKAGWYPMLQRVGGKVTRFWKRLPLVKPKGSNIPF